MPVCKDIAMTTQTRLTHIAAPEGVAGTDQLPASTAVQVVALVRPELLPEFEAFALVGEVRA
jgi:hypothetical protein